jgi:hypothetical protein
MRLKSLRKLGLMEQVNHNFVSILYGIDIFAKIKLKEPYSGW